MRLLSKCENLLSSAQSARGASSFKDPCVGGIRGPAYSLLTAAYPQELTSHTSHVVPHVHVVPLLYAYPQELTSHTWPGNTA